ncbi:MAG TPA: hypothetical protein VFV19_06290 [Candidatus Polarisedimenticolaceae bacterium]|nr:hypothetical protein [Candidatus Polarisedimenticolaceae bacterium]
MRVEAALADRTTDLSSILTLNVALLMQAEELLERIDDAHYLRTDPLSPGGGISLHMRHCLEFYGCFLRGLPRGRIDYVRRQRGGAVERSRMAALREVRATIAALERLEDAAILPTLAVRAEECVDDIEEDWTSSTAAREAQFLASHTTHHFAVVAILLRSAGIEPPADFGVAPSTLRHWRKEAS